MTECPCYSNKKYLDCCGRFIDRGQTPQMPEELMRSRYTAYTKADIDYIAKTMKSPASDNFNKVTAKKWALSADWKKLEVIRSSTENNTGWVEFIAYFMFDGSLQTIHELSQFKLDQGKWYYVDGKHLS